MNRYEIVESAPSSKGKTLLLKYIEGEKLTPQQSIAAKCCECMGYYSDGKEDCGMQSCPLYPFMPYKIVKEEKKKRVVSEAAIKALKEWRQKRSSLPVNDIIHKGAAK